MQITVEGFFFFLSCIIGSLSFKNENSGMFWFWLKKKKWRVDNHRIYKYVKKKSVGEQAVQSDKRLKAEQWGWI